MSKYNLEDFFKNRAEGYEFQYRESDWHLLEAKLDAMAPAVDWFTKLKWMLAGAGILTILLLGTWTVNEYLSETKSDLQVVTNSAEHLEPENVEITESQQKIKSGGQNSLQEAADYPGNFQQEPATANKNEPVVLPTVGRSDEDESFVGEGSELVATSPVAEQTDQANYQMNLEMAKINIQNVDQQGIGYQFMPFAWPPFNPLMPQTEPALEPQVKHILSYSLVAAADFSGTNESGLGPAQLRYGINVEYFITPQISIGVGANLTDKTYNAMGREYSPSKGYWTNGVVPETTSAECLVFDVPVTLSFFQPISAKSTLAIQAGASSWFMLKEKYYYHYDNPDPDLVKYWHGNNENNYWFGVINLSIGYSYNFNNKWGILVGPYINFPLTGIGHGNVNLKSLGIKSAIRFSQYRVKFH